MSRTRSRSSARSVRRLPERRPAQPGGVQGQQPVAGSVLLRRLGLERHIRLHQRRAPDRRRAVLASASPSRRSVGGPHDVTHNFTIDTRKPDTTHRLGDPAVTDQQPRRGRSRSAAPTRTRPNGLATGVDKFECSIDGGAFATCASPYTTPVPAEGDHDLPRSAPSTGPATPTTRPPTLDWIVDTTPPDVTITNPAAKERYLLHDAITPGLQLHRPDPAAPAGPASPPDPALHRRTRSTTRRSARTSSRSRRPTTPATRPIKSRRLRHRPAPLRQLRPRRPPGRLLPPQRAYPSASRRRSDDGGLLRPRQPRHLQERLRPRPHRRDQLRAPPAPAARLRAGSRPARTRPPFFAERDGYGYVNNLPASPSGYTMEAWVKPRRGGAMMIMSHGRAGQLFIDDSGRLAFEQSPGHGQRRRPGRSTPARWSHVAATWDRATGMTRLYVNGDPGQQLDHGQQGAVGHHHPLRRLRREGPLVQRRDRRGRPLRPRAQRPPDQRPQQDRHRQGQPLSPGRQHAAEHRGPVHRPGAAEEQRPLRAGEGCRPPTSAAPTPTTPSPRRTPTSPRCDATVDGNADRSAGDALPDSIGVHTFIVTAIDEAGNTYVHAHNYDVQPFSTIYGRDPLVAYYRLGDGSGTFMRRQLAEQPRRRIQERHRPGPGRDRRRRRHRPPLHRRRRLRLRQQHPRADLRVDARGLDRPRRPHARPVDRLPRRRRRALPRGRDHQVPPRPPEPRPLLRRLPERRSASPRSSAPGTAPT